MPEHTQQSIILTNGSRLVREMLNRILLKTQHFNVIQEISEYKNLPLAIEQHNVGWVIISLPQDDRALEWIDTFMMKHPLVRFLAVSPDGSHVKIKWMEQHEEKINNPSLEDLIQILESEPMQV